MNTENNINTTIFYWELNNDRPTGRLKTTKCHFFFDFCEKTYVIPTKEDRVLTTFNCPLFSVTTYEKEKVIYLSYYFTRSYGIDTPHVTTLDETEPPFLTTMKFDISKGEAEILENDYTFPVIPNFEIIPDQVLKFCFKEIRRLQGIKDFFPLVIKGKEPGNTLYLPFCDIHFHTKKTYFSIEYLKAIIEYPYIPFLYFLKENLGDILITNANYEQYIPWHDRLYGLYVKFDDINGLDPKSYKEFFKVINKIPSKLYLRRVFKNLEKFAKQLYQNYIRSHGVEGFTWKDE